MRRYPLSATCFSQHGKISVQLEKNGNVLFPPGTVLKDGTWIVMAGSMAVGHISIKNGQPGKLREVEELKLDPENTELAGVVEFVAANTPPRQMLGFVLGHCEWIRELCEKGGDSENPSPSTSFLSVTLPVLRKYLMEHAGEAVYNAEQIRVIEALDWINEQLFTLTATPAEA